MDVRWAWFRVGVSSPLPEGAIGFLHHLPKAEVHSYKSRCYVTAEVRHTTSQPASLLLQIKAKGAFVHISPCICNPFTRHFVCAICAPHQRSMCPDSLCAHTPRQAAPCLCSAAPAVFCARWVVELLLSHHARCLLS